MRVIGLDPGLRRTGWGVLDMRDNRLTAVACGVIASDPAAALADRLAELYRGLIAILALHRPGEAAVEETFVNKNPVSTLKLGQARAISLLAPALAGLAVFEYPANAVKKAVVGAGHADKRQVAIMVQHLIPGLVAATADASDALAVAICHAHHAGSARRWAAAERQGGSGYLPALDPAR